MSVFVDVHPALMQLTGNLSGVLCSLHAGIDLSFLLGQCNSFMEEKMFFFTLELFKISSSVGTKITFFNDLFTGDFIFENIFSIKQGSRS